MATIKQNIAEYKREVESNERLLNDLEGVLKDTKNVDIANAAIRDKAVLTARLHAYRKMIADLELMIDSELKPTLKPISEITFEDAKLVVNAAVSDVVEVGGWIDRTSSDVNGIVLLAALDSDTQLWIRICDFGISIVVLFDMASRYVWNCSSAVDKVRELGYVFSSDCIEGTHELRDDCVWKYKV